MKNTHNTSDNNPTVSMSNGLLKLSREERHTAYILMLDELYRHWYEDTVSPKRRMCHIIYYLFGITNDGFYNGWKGDWFWTEDSGWAINLVIYLYFPELNDKKPEDDWPSTDISGMKQREQWLKQCIEETNF